jgi:ankyrin repeat protein
MIDRIVNGRTDLVFDHLAAGGAAAATDENGVPLIGWCAYYGDVSAIRQLLDHGESLDRLGEDRGLGAAAFHHHWQLCQFLIERGADACLAHPETGETALHAALSRAASPALDQVVAVLLDAGADPNAPAKDEAETGSFMRDVRTTGETPLHRAAAYAGEVTIRRLVDAGGRRDLRDSRGDTPLGWASRHLRPASILRLLCFGDYSIHPQAEWTGDHGAGWSGLDANLVGRAHVSAGGQEEDGSPTGPRSRS